MAALVGNAARKRLTLRELRKGGRSSFVTAHSSEAPPFAELELWPDWVWA